MKEDLKKEISSEKFVKKELEWFFKLIKTMDKEKCCGNEIDFKRDLKDEGNIQKMIEKTLSKKDFMLDSGYPVYLELFNMFMDVSDILNELDDYRYTLYEGNQFDKIYFDEIEKVYEYISTHENSLDLFASNICPVAKAMWLEVLK